MSSAHRRRLVGTLGLALFVLVVLRFAGVVEIPARFLVAAWAVDLLLGLAELGIMLAAARAFFQGSREGGVLMGYDRWIDREQELGLPGPVVALARAELRLYRRLARLLPCRRTR